VSRLLLLLLRSIRGHVTSRLLAHNGSDGAAVLTSVTVLMHVRHLRHTSQWRHADVITLTSQVTARPHVTLFTQYESTLTYHKHQTLANRHTFTRRLQVYMLP